MKSLKPRLLTAIFGIAILIVILIVGDNYPAVISGIVGAASAFMVGEYLHAKNLLKRYLLSVPCILFPFAISFLLTTQYWYLAAVVFFITVFAVMIKNHNTISYIDLAYAVCGTMLISFGMSALSAVCSSGKGVPLYFVTAFALPWMTDAGGFFIGAAFGKRKLCPNISPKKTVEGALGGIAFCLLTSVAIWLLFDFVVMPNEKINLFALLLLAVIDAPVSILGDLSFSLIKRSLKIKDYGSIFPGHGGMLDRFDSIIFTAPVLLVINQIFPLIAV